MKEQIRSKPEIMAKLKEGSLGIAVICCIAALLTLVISALRLFNTALNETDLIQRYTVCRGFVSDILTAAIMTAAAVMFFRIAKDGIPFTAKNVRTVRIIGILFLVNAVIPSVTAAGFIGTANGVGGIVNPSALAEGLLFLFIAHIIRYGAMLQQESDETL